MADQYWPGKTTNEVDLYWAHLDPVLAHYWHAVMDQLNTGVQNFTGPIQIAKIGPFKLPLLGQ